MSYLFSTTVQRYYIGTIFDIFTSFHRLRLINCLKKGFYMSVNHLSLQGEASLLSLFFFGAFNASKIKNVFRRLWRAPQGLMCIGGASPVCLLQCLYLLNQWESFFGYRFHMLLFIGVSWYDNITKDTEISPVFHDGFCPCDSLFLYASLIIKKRVFHCYFIYNRVEDLLILFKSFNLIGRISYVAIIAVLFTLP